MRDKIIERDISKEMETSYIDYSMSSEAGLGIPPLKFLPLFPAPLFGVPDRDSPLHAFFGIAFPSHWHDGNHTTQLQAPVTNKPSG